MLLLRLSSIFNGPLIRLKLSFNGLSPVLLLAIAEQERKVDPGSKSQFVQLLVHFSETAGLRG